MSHVTDAEHTLSNPPESNDIRHRPTSDSPSHTRLARRIQRYRHLSDRPRQTRKAPAPYSYNETDEIIRLAEIWLPFGEPPEEEIFTRFGMTKQMYRERLEKELATM